MAGNRPLVCHGFLETDTFKKAKERLREISSLSDREIDDRVGALEWAFQRDRDPEIPLTRRVGERNLWTAVTDEPHLRCFLRPRATVENECEWLWIEEPD
jgi:hypothetical protein